MFAKHWQTAKEFTLAVAEAMPADGYDFKPNPEEMSFGQVMIHIADANSRSFARVAGTEALPKPAAADRETVLKYLTASFDKCAKEFDGVSAEQLDRMIGPEGKQVVAREQLWAIFTHTAHHRGQAEVYLRVKNIKPPAYRF
jgi:uncharacterized damage-inducible protein DinB